MNAYVLLLQCPDHPGIIAKLTNWIFQHDGNIIRSDQYSSDPSQGQFFIRLEFCFSDDKISLAPLQEKLSPLTSELQASWQLFSVSEKPRMGILVSQHDHCLFDLLYHYQSGDLAVDIPLIISNHQKVEQLAKQYQIDFHYLPMTDKTSQEQSVLDLVAKNTDFLVLARYMQILSKEFLHSYSKDIINIHHSFLPSFVGANPYRQAHERGVKLIGATAHYVTEELDEGPIIEQMVERVSHSDSPRSLKRKGKNIEKLTLLRAVEAHIDHRVIRYGNKTIIF